MRSGFLGFVCVLLLNAAMTQLANADVILLPSVSAAHGMMDWHTSVAHHVDDLKARGNYPKTGYTECGETTELKNAILCMSYEQREMNSVFARATIYVEGLFGFAKGTIVSHRDPVYQKNAGIIGGHDLKSSDLRVFFREVAKACLNDRDKCLSAQEKELFDAFLRARLLREDPFVLIAYGLNSAMDAVDVVSHEIVHAQYFLLEGFRAVCDRFWSERVSVRHKEEVRTELAKYYNVQDEVLLRNEFQAYLLMAGAYGNLLGFWVDHYREPLMRELGLAGFEPIQVKW